MRNFKRIAAAAISATMLLSTMSLNAFAAVMPVADATAVVATDIEDNDAVKATLEASAVKVAPGGTFDLTLKVAGVNDATKALNVGYFLSEIKYDVNTFELVPAIAEDDAYTDEGRNSIPFALYSDFCTVNTGESKIALGDTSEFKLIPSSDFAVFNVKVSESAAEASYAFEVPYVAVATMAGKTLPYETPYSITVNVTKDATAPTEAPTTAPTEAPTTAPTEAPSETPSETPSEAPTEAPTTAPTEAPTTAPSDVTVDDVVKAFEDLIAEVPVDTLISALENALPADQVAKVKDVMDMVEKLTAEDKAILGDKLAASEKVTTALGTDKTVDDLYNAASGVASINDEITFGDITIKAEKAFDFAITRKYTDKAGNATVTITKDEKLVDEQSVEFAAGEATVDVAFGALAGVAKGDKVTISVAYTVVVGDKEVAAATASTEVTVKSKGGSGASATTPVVGGGSSGGSSSSTTATEAPTEAPTATEDATPTTPDATTAPTVTFADVAELTPWALADVEALASKGIVNGVSATEFAPNANVTREQFVKMIVGALGLEMVDTAVTFNDVVAGEYYVPYVATAVANGIVNGVSAEWFGVGENITREDMATIIYRALDLEGSAAPSFADAADIADYAKAAVAELANLGVITGYENGTFGPKANATRAEAAVVINRVLNMIAAEEEVVVEEAATETTEEVATEEVTETVAE